MSFSLPYRFIPFILAMLFISSSQIGCHSSQSTGSRSTGSQSTGTRQRIQLKVGEIREVSLPGQIKTDPAGAVQGNAVELIGTSDNQEVVEVSRPQLAPPVDTLRRASNTGPTVFQIKGITLVTANVVFSEKQPGNPGAGRVRKTYVVQVVSQ